MMKIIVFIVWVVSIAQWLGECVTVSKPVTKYLSAKQLDFLNIYFVQFYPRLR